MILDFNESQHLRLKLTRTQRKQIRRLYMQVYQEVNREVEKLKGLQNVTSLSNTTSLRQLARDIEKEYENLDGRIEDLIKSNMNEISSKVVEDSAKFATSVGLIVGSGYYNLPSEIVNRIATGKVYENNFSLSKRIWGQSQKIKRDINQIIAKGTIMNKSSYEIAKDLERYVNPLARKDWEWSKVYPGTNRKIDYNAQRLARTLVSHAYQQSIIITTKDNPFVEGLRWLVANNHRVCPICMEREGKIYKPEELPLDHPNGQCTYEAVIEKDMTEISNRIADWVHGKEDFELEKYAKSLNNL